jgi:hypothetical protein
MKVFRILNLVLALVYILVASAFCGFAAGVAVNIFEWVVK